MKHGLHFCWAGLKTGQQRFYPYGSQSLGQLVTVHDDWLGDPKAPPPPMPRGYISGAANSGKLSNYRLRGGFPASSCIRTPHTSN